MASCWAGVTLLGSFLAASVGVGLEMLTSTAPKKESTTEEVKEVTISETQTAQAKPECRIYKIENRSTGKVSKIDLSTIRAGSEAYKKVQKACESQTETNVFVEYGYRIRWDFWNSWRSDWSYSEVDQQDSKLKSYLDSNPDLKK
ncbi:hypothetical protein HF1_06480 [Mycoplasma haemofelis str. Langford 1]|uniref:Uncharacterized protein n=2 Tax=Mycoplasma haemofelis TaxID=29501 RepID=F6FIE3_MYCHI|nr:hypothetical protein [Mycoplasma haemofelis]AEG72991.1 hypothetical protein MHF_0721 [Mycoplasma haemofelis Ohio2]CBY92656.1 hypothetical protein HF1_06480 [Mycoplasma haemofelis str. Langford 1]